MYFNDLYKICFRSAESTYYSRVPNSMAACDNLLLVKEEQISNYLSQKNIILKYLTHLFLMHSFSTP